MSETAVITIKTKKQTFLMDVYINLVASYNMHSRFLEFLLNILLSLWYNCRVVVHLIRPKTRLMAITGLQLTGTQGNCLNMKPVLPTGVLSMALFANTPYQVGFVLVC